jgi:hypothetical protein
VRPKNFLTDTPRPSGPSIHADWPEVTLELVVRLEDEFKPMCMQPQDNRDEHMHYSGAVTLTQRLREIHEAQQADQVHPQAAPEDGGIGEEGDSQSQELELP